MYGHERSLVEELKDQPFALIGVNSDSDLEKIRKTVKEKNLTWRSFQNEPKGSEGSISAAWGVKGWPTVVILDKEMRIRYRGHSGDQAIAVVRELLAKGTR